MKEISVQLILKRSNNYFECKSCKNIIEDNIEETKSHSLYCPHCKSFISNIRIENQIIDHFDTVIDYYDLKLFGSIIKTPLRIIKGRLFYTYYLVEDVTNKLYHVYKTNTSEDCIGKHGLYFLSFDNRSYIIINFICCT